MRNYKRKTNQKPITDLLLDKSRSLIKRGFSVPQVAKAIGVKESSLRGALKRGKGANKLGRFRSVFTKEQEDEIVRLCIDLHQRFFGMTLKSLQCFLYDFACRNNVKHRFSNALASRDFTSGFMKRNKMSLLIKLRRSVTSTAPLNRNQINQHFDNLESLIKKYGFTPNSIYNMDERGIQMIPTQLQIPMARAKKIESSKLCHTVSVACTISATGRSVPPFFVFTQNLLDSNLIKDIQDGCNMAATDKGRLDTPAFIKWLKYFKDLANPSQERPVLLILDNRVAHVGLEAVSMAETHHIYMLSLPPCSSHKTQPINRNLFESLEDEYNVSVANWIVCHPRQVPSVYDVAEIFKVTFEQVATTEKAVQGFHATGIFPVNRNTFSESDFLSAERIDSDAEEEEYILIDEKKYLISFGDESSPETSEAGDISEEDSSAIGSSTLVQVSEQDLRDAEPSTSKSSDFNPA